MATREEIAQALEQWQEDVHWWGDPLPCEALADAVLVALGEELEDIGWGTAADESDYVPAGHLDKRKRVWREPQHDTVPVFVKRSAS